MRIFTIASQLAGMDDTRPNQRHLPHYNIKQLRQFIEACFPQKSPCAGDTWIVCQLHILLKLLHQFGMPRQIAIGIGYHRAKLEGIEFFPMFAHNFTEVQDRSPVVQLDAKCDAQKDGEKEDDTSKRENNIK